MEDEEIPDFATPFIKKIARNRLMPEISLKLYRLCTNIPIRRLLDSLRNTYTYFCSVDKLRKLAELYELCKSILRTLKGLSTESFLGINIAIAP